MRASYGFSKSLILAPERSSKTLPSLFETMVDRGSDHGQVRRVPATLKARFSSQLAVTIRLRKVRLIKWRFLDLNNPLLFLMILDAFIETQDQHGTSSQISTKLNILTCTRVNLLLYIGGSEKDYTDGSPIIGALSIRAKRQLLLYLAEIFQGPLLTILTIVVEIFEGDFGSSLY